MANEVVVVRDVSRTFDVPGGEVHALSDITFSVAGADFTALIGRSGSGKTTLLNIIAGLDLPTEGSVTIAGEEITRMSEGQRTLFRRRHIGFVFQSFGLLPLLSAEENVELALRIAGAGIRERGKRAREVLDLVGLGGRRRHRPYELSGGEQQRVAIARAIANRPPLILADEPTGELDSTTALQIFELLQHISRNEGSTILTTTHDQLVMDHVDHVVELADGRIVGTDETSELLAFGRRRRLGAGLEPASRATADGTIHVTPRSRVATAPVDESPAPTAAEAPEVPPAPTLAEPAPTPAEPETAPEPQPEEPDYSRWARPNR